MSGTGGAARRRPRWPWIVGVGAVVLVVVAVVGGEWAARSAVERTIRTQAIEALHLPADQQIDVAVPGLVLPQLIVGSLAEVDVSSRDVPLQDVTASIAVSAQDVPVRGDGDWSGAHATVTMDAAQLQALLAHLDGFPAATVTLDEPDVTATFDIDALVTKLQVGAALTPRAEDGTLVLTPSSLNIGGVQISADAIRERFGSLAATVVRDWDVCVAQYFPRALTLTEVGVTGDELVAVLEIDSSILRDASARENGICP